MRPIGPCPKCGQSDLDPPPYIPPVRTGLRTDTYCPKCSTQIVHDCKECGGTGVTIVYPLPKPVKNCDKCERPNKPRRERCYACNGTGDIIDPHYVCPGR